MNKALVVLCGIVSGSFYMNLESFAARVCTNPTDCQFNRSHESLFSDFNLERSRCIKKEMPTRAPSVQATNPVDMGQIATMRQVKFKLNEPEPLARFLFMPTAGQLRCQRVEIIIVEKEQQEDQRMFAVYRTIHGKNNDAWEFVGEVQVPATIKQVSVMLDPNGDVHIGDKLFVMSAYYLNDEGE